MTVTGDRWQVMYLQYLVEVIGGVRKNIYLFTFTYSLYSPLTAPSQSSHTAPTLATSGRQLDSCHHGLSLSITSSQTHHRGKTE